MRPAALEHPTPSPENDLPRIAARRARVPPRGTLSARSAAVFLKEAMLRCAVLQQETAARYDALCDQAPTDEDSVRAWRGAALRERRRAGFLDALANLCAALEDEGPFLVEIPLQVDEVRRALDHVAWRHESCAERSACACAELLRAVPAARLYADLVELAEPEVRRALRMIANEIRIVRRDANGGAARREAALAAAPPA